MAQTIVIFGASGDLTSRKLLPAIYSLHQKKRLPADTNIVGFSRTEFSHDAWRQRLAESTAEFAGPEFDVAAWNSLAPRLFYFPGSVECGEDFPKLGALLGRDRRRWDGGAGLLPVHRPAALRNGRGEPGRRRHGRRSPRTATHRRGKALRNGLGQRRRLNRNIHEVFAENQVYRIDHYLGKETVQNVLVLRFANTIFEPVWNRNYIDHVEITAAESLTVGHRAGYYDTAGVLRDMLQGHLLQLLTLTAMETPVRFEAEAVRDEKVKVLRAVRPMQQRRRRPATPSAANIKDIARNRASGPDSQTATFAAIKLHVDNWRWQGVPFYLRSGKAMSCATTQLVIQFRQPPYMLFGDGPRNDPASPIAWSSRFSRPKASNSISTPKCPTRACNSA